MGTARARTLWLALLAGLLLLGPGRLVVRESITDFMPRGERSRALAIARELADSTLARGLVLCIGHPTDRAGALDLADALARSLARHPEIAWVRAGLVPGEREALRALYFPRRHYLASDRPEREIPERTDDASLRRRARRLRAELAAPLPTPGGELAARDPLGLFAAIVGRLGARDPGLRIEGERFVAVDAPAGGSGAEAAAGGARSWAVVLAETRGSPFDASRQAPLQRAIAERFARLASERGGGFLLEQGGSHRIALATERAMRRDVRFVSLITMIGVPGLLGLLLGSARGLLLVLAPVLAGLAAATAVGMQLFGSLHLVTLAFGASLVGVAADYAIHLMSHHTLAPPGAAPSATARRLRTAVLLGAGTTIAGFGGFVWTDFPGVREMGIFAICGVATTAAATLLAVPAFLPAGRPPPRLPAATAARLARWNGRLTRRGGTAVLWPCGAVALAAVGLPQLRWVDDPAALVSPDPALLAEEERVRRRVSPLEARRFVVAQAPDAESALALNDRIWLRLQPLIDAGRLEGVASLHAVLWSRELQQRNLAALRADPSLPERLERAFAREGFRPGAFARWREELAEPTAGPLTLEDLARSPLAPRVRPHWIEQGGAHWTVTYLRGVREPAAVEEALAGLAGVHFFDADAVGARLFAETRRGALILVALGGGLVFAALWMRYRSARAAGAALLPALLAIPTSLAVLALLGAPLNLLGAVSLVLLLGLGVDYGVFIVEGAPDRARDGATLLSLLLSCLTTLFAFGVLAFSSHPALRSIGMVTGLGVLIALLTAPAAAALARPPRGAAGPGPAVSAPGRAGAVRADPAAR